MHDSSSPFNQAKNVKVGEGDAVSSRLREFERERELLSRNTRDPTVGGLRAEKEKGSTRRELRVGTGFRKLLQTS